ncbi:MAG: acyl-CoA dehydrogenase [Chloroflexi bacterium CG07_land_8_20_14_0_80_51_10]|nr:MAG: acyl-CoA dehydrogenase [Chloroflexi bacterium CG07_land_8_20_14_0_80_51_10]
MDFDLTEEQTMFRNMAREFGERHIIPVASDDDRNGRFPIDIIKGMAALGLLGGPVPQEYGGLGIDNVCYGIICEEIARASAAVFTSALTVQVSLVQLPILRYGSEEQKQKWLTRTTKGELLGCFALTEPNVGSDAASIETSAVLDGDHWVLNGSKMWISNGGVADLALVFAQTDKAKRHRGIAAFIVERGTPGFSSRDFDKMGLHSSNTAELSFQDCRVPAANVLGNVGEGFRIAMYALDCGRFSTAAACVGVAQACIDASIKFAQERQQFGKTIASFQLIQEMIADMTVETEAARFLVYRVGDLKDKGRPIVREASIAKYYAAEVAIRAAQNAIKVHGGYGYSDDYPVGRYLRDAVGMNLYEGTSQIQKLIVGREALGVAAFV